MRDVAETRPTSRTPSPFRGIASAQEQAAEWVEWTCFGLLLGGLAWVPLFYGSNTLWGWGVNGVLFPGLAALYEMSLLVRGRRHAVGLRVLAVPAMLFAAVFLWIFVQRATWVPVSLAHPIWQMTAEALGAPVQGSISVNRDLTELALLRLITAASVLWLAIQLCRDGRRAFWMIGAIAAIGAVYALYGLIVLKSGQLPWLAIPVHDGLVSSTFFNRDCYATYAGLGLIATAGLILHVYQAELATSAAGWRHQLGAAVGATGHRATALLAGGLLILVALLMTGSRGGVLAAGASIAALVAMISLRRDRHIPASIIPATLVTLLIVAAVFVFGDAVAGKIERNGLGDSNRLAVYLITVRSILDRPLLGFGYGTFIDVFPMYRDQSISVNGIWGQAHNTYLELFQGLGSVFGSLLIGAVLVLALHCLKGARQRQQDAIIARVGVAAAVFVGCHALVGFGLQMQANALTFMAMLGAGVAQSRSSRAELSD